MKKNGQIIKRTKLDTTQEESASMKNQSKQTEQIYNGRKIKCMDTKTNLEANIVKYQYQEQSLPRLCVCMKIVRDKEISNISFKTFSMVNDFPMKKMEQHKIYIYQ